MPIFGRRVAYKPKHMRSVEEDSDTDISQNGIEGMKWGVKRFQNPDGSLTQEGLVRYTRKNSCLCDGSNGTQLERMEK